MMPLVSWRAKSGFHFSSPAVSGESGSADRDDPVCHAGIARCAAWTGDARPNAKTQVNSILISRTDHEAIFPSVLFNYQISNG
jgi:hypothetical protein